MQTFFEEKNPFYILNASPRDNRARIMAKAEEKSFFSSDNSGEEAQAQLLSPARRLAAELDWFYDEEHAHIPSIRDSIRRHTAIDTAGLIGISALNALLNNFCLADYASIYDMGYALLDLDRQYNQLNIGAVTGMVNACRQQAGMRLATPAEMDEGLRRKRDVVRRILDEKMKPLDQDSYIRLFTLLTQNCIAAQGYEDGAILSDAVDQYEVRMQPVLEEKTDDIARRIEDITNAKELSQINRQVEQLIEAIKDWDVVAQPLHLRAMASGMPHPASQKLADKLRHLTEYLHNERGASEAALNLLSAMQEVFAELDGIAATLKEGYKTLHRIYQSNRKIKEITSELRVLNQMAEHLCQNASREASIGFANKIKELNTRVKTSGLDKTAVRNIRVDMFNTASHVMMILNNEWHHPDYMLHVAQVLFVEFSDIPECHNIAGQCVKAGNDQAFMKKMVRGKQVSHRQQKRKARITVAAAIGAMALIFCLATLIQPKPEKPHSTHSSPSYTYDAAGQGTTGTAGPSFDLILDRQGGEGGSSSVSVQHARAMPPADPPHRDGYIFNGYYESPDGGGDKYYNADMSSAAAWNHKSGGKLYAYWTKEGAITLNKSNFEDYFNLDTSAVYTSDGLEVTYEVTPKDTGWAAHSDSSPSVEVDIEVCVYIAQYSDAAFHSDTISLTLDKSKDYTASGTYNMSFFSFLSTIYWDTQIGSCSGTLYG